MFFDVGNPGFFKIVGAVRWCLTVDEKYKPLLRYGNPLVFEAARIWVRDYENMSVIGGEEWARDIMVNKLFYECIKQSISRARAKIDERTDGYVWHELPTLR